MSRAAHGAPRVTAKARPRAQGALKLLLSAAVSDAVERLLFAKGAIVHAMHYGRITQSLETRRAAITLFFNLCFNEATREQLRRATRDARRAPSADRALPRRVIDQGGFDFIAEMITSPDSFQADGEAKPVALQAVKVGARRPPRCPLRLSPLPAAPAGAAPAHPRPGAARSRLDQCGAARRDLHASGGLPRPPHPGPRGQAAASSVECARAPRRPDPAPLTPADCQGREACATGARNPSVCSALYALGMARHRYAQEAVLVMQHELGEAALPPMLRAVRGAAASAGEADRRRAPRPQRIGSVGGPAAAASMSMHGQLGGLQGQ